MTATRLLLAASLVLGYPLHAVALTPAAAATPPDTKPTKAELKAKKKEEIAREKAAVATPLDAKAAMDARIQIKEKRAACRQEAKAKNVSLMLRRSFMKECEAG